MGADVTVSFALRLVVLPLAFVTTTANPLPLSPAVVGPVV
jgi:hypothetical protein